MHPHTTKPALSSPPSTFRHAPALDDIWLYGRNSTDEQVEACTIKSQKDAVYRDAAAKGERISREYVDEGRSGFTLTREQLDQMREDMRAPGCRCRKIKIFDKSRLARKAVLRHIVEDEAARQGICIEYIAAPIFDESPEGQFAEGVTDQLDEYLAAKIKQNLTRGRYYDVRDGHVWWAPYGYDLIDVPGEKYPRVTIDEDLRPICREIVTRIIAGESAGAMARSLNTRGIPSPSVVQARKRGKPNPPPAQWSDKTISNMIHNPYYAGHASYDRTERCLPADPTKRYRKKEKSSHRRRDPEEWYTTEVPALWTDEEKAAAEAGLASGRERSPRNTKSQYLLQRRLRCPECGRRLVGQTKNPGTPKEYRFYRCSTLRQIPGTTRTARCPTRVPCSEVEPLVVAYLAQRMEDREGMRAAFNELRGKPDREREQWQARLVDLDEQEKRLEKRLKAVYEKHEDGVYEKDEFEWRKRQILDDLIAARNEKMEAQTYLAHAHERQVLWKGIEAFCDDLAQRFRQYTGPEHFPQRQRAVQALVTTIDVYSDRFAIRGVLRTLDGDVARPDNAGAICPNSPERAFGQIAYLLTLPRARRGQFQQGLDGSHDAGCTFVLG